MQKASWQTFCQLRFLLKSTVKSSEPSIRLLSKVLYKTPLQPLVYSTSTLIPTVAGLLRSSRVFCSKSSAMQTQSHKELVAERATSSSVLQTLHPPSPWQAFSITHLHSTLTLTLMTLVTPSLVFCKASIVYISILIQVVTSANGTPGNQYYVVGYKGTSPYDAGLFYCPYVPLQMVRAVGENTFQPKIEASRPVTVWLPTHSQKEPIKVWVVSRSMQTATIVALQSRTSCDPSFTCHQGPFGVLFFAYR